VPTSTGLRTVSEDSGVKSACPPVGSLSDVGACSQKHLDRGPIRSLHCSEQRVLAETVVGQWVIDCRLQLQVSLKESAYAVISTLRLGSC
jgi:hypothetical protein